MKILNKTKSIILAVLGMAIMFASINSCSDDMSGKTFLTSDDIMIDEYIIQKDQSMSTFLDIIDQTGFRGMIHAYGTYTCFIPTNEAIDSYVKDLGKNTWEELPQEVLAEFIKFHIANDTLRTSDFVDGKLPEATLSNKYLTTKTEVTNEGAKVRVNRQGLITKKDIYCANGYIHKIDQVLTPNQLTIGEEIENLPENFALFKKVMKKTGWTDELSDKKKEGWYTVFIQSDEAFAKVGIKTEADLLTRLAKDRYDIPTDKERLWTYAAYQVVKGLNYVADLSYLSALQPQAPNQAITLRLDKNVLLVNEYNNSVAGTVEPGTPVDKESNYTDYSCSNGVLIDMTGYIGPVKRSAVPVYWDIAEQPELIKRKEFRKSSFNVPLSELSEMTFELRNTAYTSIGYKYAGGFNTNGQYVNHDYLAINMNRITSISFKTPLLIEGTYNVWICFRRAGYGDKIRGIFQQEGREDQEMSDIVDLSEYFTTSSNAQTLLASGMKRYTAKQRSSTLNSRRLGTIVVESTGRHILKIEANNQVKAGDTQWDMIQFIPVDHDQLWPRFDMSGAAIYPGTDCKDIYPDMQSCSADNDEY